MLEAHPDIEVVVTPVGGGGLMSGTAIAAHGFDPRIVVFGAEPAGADDASRSFASGHVEPMDQPQTIADGLRSTVSERTLGAIARAPGADRHLQRRRASWRRCASCGSA